MTHQYTILKQFRKWGKNKTTICFITLGYSTVKQGNTWTDGSNSLTKKIIAGRIKTEMFQVSQSEPL